MSTFLCATICVKEILVYLLVVIFCLMILATVFFAIGEIISEIMGCSVKKIKRLRIVEISILNNMVPPGNQTIYKIQGKSCFGNWIDAEYSSYYDSYETAKRKLDVLYDNYNSGYKQTDEFNEYIDPETSGYIIEKRIHKCLKVTPSSNYSYYRSDKFDVYERYMSVDEETGENTDIDLLISYRIYKKGIFGIMMKYKSDIDESEIKSEIVELCKKKKMEIIYNN